MKTNSVNELAAPSTGMVNNGRATAINESVPGYKTIPVWKRIGQIERDRHGLKITLTDLFGQFHLLYLAERDLPKLVFDSMPGDLVGIDETTNGLVINLEGRAFRSRSGKALCIKIPGLAGGEAMVPWRAFMAVFEKRKKVAQISFPDWDSGQDS
jgi:hypothetical protein